MPVNVRWRHDDKFSLAREVNGPGTANSSKAEETTNTDDGVDGGAPVPGAVGRVLTAYSILRTPEGERTVWCVPVCSG